MSKNPRGGGSPQVLVVPPGAVNHRALVSYRPSRPVIKHTLKAQDATACEFQQGPGVTCKLPLCSPPSCAPALTRAATSGLHATRGARAEGQDLTWPYQLGELT